MGESRSAAILFLLLAGPAALAGPAPARTVNARQLVLTVDRALAGASAAARTAAGPQLAPFLGALERLRLRVEAIGDAFTRRDPEFFLLVDQGSTDLGALRVAWARAGAGNEAVAEGLRVASSAYRMLRSSYGREGFRHRQGGPLNEAEKRQFLRLQQAQRRFSDRLLRLRDAARRRGDAATVAELDRLHDTAARIAWAPLDLEAYLNSVIAVSELRGEWEADAPYMRDDAPEELAAADAEVQELYAAADIGHVFTVDLGKAGGWSYLEGDPAPPPVAPEVVAGPAAVEVYEPAEEPEEELPATEVEDAGPVEGIEVYAEALEEAFAAGEADEEAPGEEEIADGEPLEPAEGAAVGDEADPPAATAAPATAPAAGDGTPAQPEGQADDASAEAAEPAPVPPPAAPAPNAPPIG